MDEENLTPIYLGDSPDIDLLPLMEEEEEEDTGPAPIYLDTLSNEEPLPDTGTSIVLDDTVSTDLVPEQRIEYTNLTDIFKEYGGKSLTKEDIINDDRLMDVVRTSLEARFTPGGVLTKARRGVTGLTGGAIGGLSFQDYREMSNEDAFETWQNYQRSFAGAQTVTTGNEIAYGMSADDDTKAKLGAGYMLFDQMDNAFTGEGSWSEMGDAMWDYTKSAVYDPSTILSLGLGKVFGFAGTKGSGIVARKMMTQAYRDQISKGIAANTVKANIGRATLKALPVATADAVIGAGTDVVYQMQRIEVDVQEEYSGLQTALTAAGSMVVVPTLFGLGASVKEFRKSSLAPQWMSYKEFDDVNLKLGIEEAEKTLATRVKRNIKLDTVDENFGIVKGETKDFLAWVDFRNKAKERIEKRGEKYTNTDAVNAFFDYFWFGSPDGKTKGYYQTIKEAGFVLHPAMKEKYGTTGAFAQTIKFLQPAQAKKIVKKFEKDTGQKLKFYDDEGNVILSDKVTPVSLASHFAANASYAGKGLWISSQLSRLEKAGINTSDALDMMKPTTGADDPARMQYGLSVYKRLLTSHLSTTGANIKGFTQLVSLNTAADFVSAGISATQGAYYKTVGGDAEKATQFFNRAWGSSLGAARRGFDVLSPDIPMEYADKILALQPHIAEKLFRDVAGDGGVRDALSDFNLDKIKYKGAFEGLDDVEKVAWGTVDAVTKGAQTVTLVRMQDDLTKRWAFGTNVNQAIMREYGMTAEDFFTPAKANWAAVEMATDRFQKNVLEKAAQRTMRETASVNWSTMKRQTNNYMRSAARQIEGVTNRSAVGYLVPFGSFLNTTIATAGDLTAVNAFRFAVRKATGQTVDYATEEGVDLLAKGIVGWSAIGLGIAADPFGLGGMGAKERIEQGIPYNVDPQPDGSLQDRRYDWPAGTMRLMSTVVAYGFGAGTDQWGLSLDNFDPSRIPPDLKRELGLQLGGQAIRDLTGFEASLGYAIDEAVENNNWEPTLSLLPSISFADRTVDPGSGLARVAQGISRPLDPINQIVGLVTDANMNPDRRQGAENMNQMLRYVDNIFGVSRELPRRATPTRGTDFTPDVGKQIGLGTRELRAPNLVERMMTAAGQPYWKAIRFDGPPEVKNAMDALAAPFFEAAAIEYLNKNPNYFTEEMNLEERERVLKLMKEQVKEDVMNVLETGLPESMNLVRVLSRSKTEVREIMDFLGIESTLEELLKEEDGLPTLLKIKTLLDSWDDIKFYDVNE